MDVRACDLFSYKVAVIYIITFFMGLPMDQNKKTSSKIPDQHRPLQISTPPSPKFTPNFDPSIMLRIHLKSHIL